MDIIHYIIQLIVESIIIGANINIIRKNL